MWEVGVAVVVGAGLMLAAVSLSADRLAELAFGALVLVGTAAGIAHHVIGVPGPECVRRAVREAVLTALALVALVGGVQFLGGAGLVPAAAVLLTSPLARTAWGRVVPDRAKRPTWRAPGPNNAGLASRSTRELCCQWHATWLQLLDAGSPSLRGAIVEERRLILDELARRDPDGVHRWLHSTARAGADPFGYLEPGAGGEWSQGTTGVE